MSFFYKLKISYKGTNYFGFQIQNGQKLRTIQGELNKALKTIFKSEDILTIGSGRTDAKVHALGQVVRAHVPFEIEVSSLKKAINSNLPSEILVLDLEKTNDSFHPIFSAKEKMYRYYFVENEKLDPFSNEFIAGVKGELNLERLNNSAATFIGKHSFINYFCKGTPVSSYEREIFDSKVYKVENFHGLSNVFCFEVIGSGFLKQMVRLMMGTILKHSFGKLELSEIRDSLKGHKIEHLGAVAPGEGLYLVSVTY